LPWILLTSGATGGTSACAAAKYSLPKISFDGIHRAVTELKQITDVFEFVIGIGDEETYQQGISIGRSAGRARERGGDEGGRELTQAIYECHPNSIILDVLREINFFKASIQENAELLDHQLDAPSRDFSG
jgi:hypothetical protein